MCEYAAKRNLIVSLSHIFIVLFFPSSSLLHFQSHLFHLPVSTICLSMNSIPLAAVDFEGYYVPNCSKLLQILKRGSI